MITTITLNPCLDTTLYVEQLVPDDSNRVIRVQKDPGGKGLNVSRFLHKLGKRVSTLTFFGGHTGEEVEALLKQEGVFPFTVRLSNDTRNNISIIDMKTLTQTRFNQTGPFVSEGEYNSFSSMVEQLGDNANIVVLSGSLPPGVPENAYRDMIQMLKLINPKIRIILDTDKSPLKLGIEAHPFMVKPNLHEAQRLLGYSIVSQEDQIRALKDIHHQGCTLVVMSLGKEGIIGYDGQDIIRIESPEVEVQSTIGAGDALIAGICYALEDHRSFMDMLKFGVQVSAAKVTTAGTVACGWDDIDRIKTSPVITLIEADSKKNIS